MLRTRALAPIAIPLLRQLVLALLLGLAGSVGAGAPPPRTPPPPTPMQPGWAQLTPQQRDALGPLQSEWSHFGPERQRKWLDIAARYPAMSPQQQATLHRRMSDWVRMTPEQRTIARRNYLVSSSTSLQSRQQAWQKYQQLPDARKHELARQARALPATPSHLGSAPAGQAAASTARLRLVRAAGGPTHAAGHPARPKPRRAASAPAAARVGSAPASAPRPAAAASKP